MARTKAATKRTSNQRTKGLDSIIDLRHFNTGRSSTGAWYQSSAVKYVAGAVGIAILARVAYKMSDKFPEISGFIRENLDTVEGKLREFRGGDVASSDLDDARH